jgi:hypothetical protein
MGESRLTIKGKRDSYEGYLRPIDKKGDKFTINFKKPNYLKTSSYK